MLLLIAALLLGACGNVPRPFQPDEKAEGNQLLMLPDRAGVIVLPVAGLPEPMAVELAEKLAAALQRENVLATTSEGNRYSYLIEGETMPGDGGVPVAHFELRDPRGALVKTFKVPLDRAVQASGGLDFTAVAHSAAVPIAAALQPDAVNPSPPRPPLKIGKVTGAPRDGDVVLARALDYALRRNGVKLAEPNEKESFEVRGAVSIVPRGQKLRNVNVTWTVYAPDGSELGQVEQQNDVTPEFLERAWPEMASAVADGAAEGLADLLERAPVKQ
ncbi:MAG TPA: hypothetical protein VHM01_12060 [Alphaproteobacteria bacterium]|nr:hypothetical protein [Alphaproteobacteria bacterium]